MEFKYPTGSNNATFHYTAGKGILKFRTEDENKNYICSIIKIFYINFNEIYIMILEMYTIFESYAICLILFIFKGLLKNTVLESQAVSM
jgi:hypothetical protein